MSARHSQDGAKPPAGDDAFLEAMDDVVPLASPTTAPRPRADPRPTAGQLRRREAAEAEETEDPNYLHTGEVPPVEPHAVLEWKKDGVQPDVFRRLGTGRYTVAATLDLHRLTVDEARSALYRFVTDARGRGHRCVLIAHGRGERSDPPARIKSHVVFWLGQMPEVIGYRSAPRQQGGTGAMLVMLRKSDAAKGENRERYGGRAAPSEGSRSALP